MKVVYFISILLSSFPGGVNSISISPEGEVLVVEGSTLRLTCTPENTGQLLGAIRLSEVQEGNRIVDLQVPSELDTVNHVVIYSFGPVTRQQSGTTLVCRNIALDTSSEKAILNVANPPSYTPSPPVQSTTPTEGDTFMYNYIISADPQPDSYTWRRNGQIISNNSRITVTVNSIRISNVNKSDSGVYAIFSSNVAGNGSANFTLNVYYPPVLGDIQQSVTLNTGAPFTLDCTPVDEGNPPATVSFSYNNTGAAEESVTTTGYVLSVSSVVRNHRGYYSCEVSNGVGRDSVTVQLMVRAPPTVPHNITFKDVSSFTIAITWIPPSDNGGTDQPLKYSINITNNTVTLSFATSDVTTLSLTNLQHSTQYGVEIVAENEYGVSPPAASTFTTPDSVPIIESVSVEALSLTILSVDVVLLTDGGQNVTNYTVEISGGNYSFNMTFLSAHLRSYSVMLVDILTIGETYNINVSAMNSVGESTPFQLELSVTHLPSNSDHVSEDTTLAIIGAIVGVIVVILLLILMILIIVLCYLRRRKNEMKKDNDDVHFTTESEQKPIESIAIHDRPTESNGDSNSDNQLNEVKRTEPVESMYADVIHDRKSDTTREGILYADLKFPEEDQTRRKPPVEIQPVIYTEVQKVKK